MGGLSSSAFERTVTVEATPGIDSKILTNDLVITEELLGGNSGLIRIWWSFTTGASYNLTVTKKGEADLTGFPLKVNADNSFTLLADGYYRFDIGVRPGDLINLSSSVAISQVNEFQIQQIQIGV